MAIPSEKKKLKLAFLSSGRGSNLESVLEKIESGDLDAEVAFVASNNSGSGAFHRAGERGILCFHVSEKTEGNQEGVVRRLLSLLNEFAPDLLVLAGYMKKLPNEVLKRMPNRILNIHPALLPSFGGAGYYGMKVHEAVLKHGCFFTGVTVHLVDGEYDTGPILYQQIVRVEADDSAESLAARVLQVEHNCFWRVLKAFSTGDIHVDRGKLFGSDYFLKEKRF